jgi:hypothetical protein
VSSQPYADDPSLNKLLRLYGPDRTEVLVRDTMREVGIQAILSADDRMRFGAALIKKGGLLEAIGRAIRIQAILQGAREDP